ncbi:MAG: signal transduction histidine kinase [Dinoroseobacter sp.]|jgi:signal transduction histidine kinase
MSDQALSKIFTLAGPEIPARHQTLNYFLNTIINPESERSQMIAAVESDPRILLHFLSVKPPRNLINWHEALSNQALFEQSVLLANSANLSESGKYWQRANLAARIAGLLSAATDFDSAGRVRCRLLALLLDAGRPEPKSSVTIGFLAEEAAQSLGRLGLSLADCDVVRYQHEGLDVLNDATKDQVLVAMAGRLAEVMLTNLELAEQYSELIERRLGINPEKLSSLLEVAYSSFRVRNDELLSISNFESNLSRANVALQMQHCAQIESLSLFAREVFAVQKYALATREEDKLVVLLGDDHFSVSVESNSSLINQVFQSQTAFSAEDDALVAIVDKQLLSRFATSALWLVPAGRFGVVIFGVDNIESAARQDQFLVSVFSNSCARTFDDSAESSIPMIELDGIQKRVRELTHEVNNPLSIVQNYLKTLSLKLDRDATFPIGIQTGIQADIQTISSEMLRIGVIIQDFAEIGTESKSALRAVDINELLRALTSVVQGSHPDISVRCELDSAMPIIDSHSDLLKQAFLNLLKNAAEALVGASKPRIGITSSGRVNLGGQHFVEILIDDNGFGVSPEIYQNLFAANNTDKGGDHSGLGLSVAYRLITDLGGLISCKTSQTSGTQFQILLPIEQKPK